LRRDVNDVHFEEVPRLCPIDQYWPSQGVDEIEIHTVQIRARRCRRNGAIERITRFQHHRVARLNA
jgi:hypothetical protein